VRREACASHTDDTRRPDALERLFFGATKGIEGRHEFVARDAFLRLDNDTRPFLIVAQESWLDFFDNTGDGRVKRHCHHAAAIRNLLAAFYRVPDRNGRLNRSAKMLIDRDGHPLYVAYFFYGKAAGAVLLLGWMCATPESFGSHDGKISFEGSSPLANAAYFPDMLQ
jgi:hypothetical protein